MCLLTQTDQPEKYDCSCLPEYNWEVMFQDLDIFAYCFTGIPWVVYCTPIARTMNAIDGSSCEITWMVNFAFFCIPVANCSLCCAYNALKLSKARQHFGIKGTKMADCLMQIPVIGCAGP